LPTVYCSLYPADQTRFPALRTALRNLAMNDAALQAPSSVSPTSSPALGFGFRVGFSGMLHMDIVRERLCDEFGVEVILAQPSVGVVVEKRRLSSGEVLGRVTVEEASAFPTSAELAATNGVVAKLMEPRATVEVTAPTQFDGDVIKLGLDRRGEILDHRHIGGGDSGPSSSLRSVIVFDMPLSGVIGTLFDKLKSATKGYGSMSYVVSGYKEADLVRVEVWVNDEEVGPLATVCHRSESVRTGRKLVDAVREHVEREMFAVKIQARVGGKVVASEALSAIRKDVTAKCYGGDISRKKKLLKKQAEGKKRMRRFGKVEVGIDCFKEILKLDIDG
jgi:GTP-binding protein LepA